MVINNRINPSFGVAGSFSGYILLIAGLSTANTWVGIILILLGAFFAFSFSGTSVEKEKNRFRQYTKLFGFIKVGDWEDLTMYKELAILKNDTSFRVFSRGNRAIDSKANNYLIYMIGDDIRFKIPLKKCRNTEIAKTEAENLSKELNMPIIDA